MAKHRWIIERDYEELKQELGLGHFEGRNWRGTVFPPQPAQVICDSPRTGQRRTSAHADRRPERHNPTSIATFTIILAQLLLERLPYCPFCGSRSGRLLPSFSSTRQRQFAGGPNGCRPLWRRRRID